jgi:DNA invertase Pin-like site-specific DNA recombinase
LGAADVGLGGERAGLAAALQQPPYPGGADVEQLGDLLTAATALIAGADHPLTEVLRIWLHITFYASRYTRERSALMSLKEALARHPNRKVVLLCRESSPKQVANGALKRQERECRKAIRNEGGEVVAEVGSARARRGKLEGRRSDLRRARDLAEKHGAILCVLNITRLFRPACYDSKTNPDAVYTADDYGQLWAIVGGIPVAVIESLDLGPKDLHSRATKRGMAQARAEGRHPGRPSSIPNRTKRLILRDRRKGLSISQIAKRYGLAKSTVNDFLVRKRG